MTTQQIKTETTDNEQEIRTRRAFRLILVLGIVILSAATASFFRIWAEHEFVYQPDMVEPGAGIVAGFIFIGTAFLAKRGYVTLAIIIISVTFFAVDLFLITRLTEIGLWLTVAIVVGLILVASQVLPQKYIVPTVVTIFLVGSTLMLLDQFWTLPRGTVDPEDMQIVYLAAAIILIVASVVAIRQFPAFSLRTKLVSGAITLVVITVFLTTILVNNFARSSLTEQLNEKFQLVGQSQSLAIAELLTRQVEIIETLSLDSGLRTLLFGRNQGYSPDPAVNVANVLKLDTGWEDNTGLQDNLTSNTTAVILRNEQERFPEHVEMFLTDNVGAIVGATNVTSDYYQADEDWWQSAYNEGQGAIYIGEPEFDESSGVIAINIAIPMFDIANGEFLGILHSTYQINGLKTLLNNAGGIGATGHLDLLFKENGLHIEDDSIALEPIEFDEAFLNRLRESSENIIANTEDGRNVLNLVPLDTGGEIPVIDALGWSLVISQAEQEAFTAVRVQQQLSIIMALIAIVVGAIVAVYAARFVANPINRLTETAVIIAEGNLNRRASVETQDEIGTLAIAFNRMTSQLREFIGSLEERVTERTKALATTTEVSRQLSTIIDMDELVTEVVNQIRNSFGYYHAQIYLYDEEKIYLVMAGGTGTAGQKMLDAGHKLEDGRGLVGRSAATNKVVLISDVVQEDNWLPNELLPDTKSEAAIPIALRNEVLGVLDVQSNVAAGLDDESVDLLQSIANQVAIAIQNARQYAQTQNALADSERLYKLSEEQAQRLAILNEMSAEFNTAVDVQAIYDSIRDKILSIISGEIASLALLNVADQQLEITWLSGENTTLVDKQKLPITNTAIGRAIKENRLLSLSLEHANVNEVDALQFAETGFHSLMLIPLAAGGQILGTLNIGSKRKHAFEDIDIGFVQQVASTIATNIEGQRVGAQARLLASIVENHPDFIGVSALDGHVLYINPSGLQLMNLDPGVDMSQLNTKSFYADEEAALLMGVGLETAIKTGGWSAEMNLKTADGTFIPVEETIGINYDANHQPAGFNLTMRDITERKEAELAIQESRATADTFQEKLTILYEMTIDLSREADLDKVFEHAIRDARAKLGLDRLGVWLFNYDVTEMYGTYGVDAQGQMVDARHLREKISPDSDGGWILPFIQDNKNYLVNEDVDLYDDHVMVGHGWQVIVVLWHDQQPLGFLAVDNLIQQKELQPYEPDLILLCANALSGIIINKRAEAIQAKQARELQTVAEVSRVATTILDTKELMQQTADLTKDSFGLYHVHIYLLNPTGEILVLTAGAGEIGRIMVEEGRQIPVQQKQSLVAQAARTKKGVVVNNVRMEEGFLPNPLLPETRAELATPIMVGDEVLGVLDIQSNVANYFTQSDIDTHLTLASQIAVAMQNAAQYQRTQEALNDVTRMQQLLVRDGWKSFMQDEDQFVQGYRYDQQNLQPMKRNSEKLGFDAMVGSKDTAVTLPLTVRGTNIGKLGVRDASGKPVSVEKQELLRSMSLQVAEALERARLFQQAEVARTQTESALQETQRRTEELAILNRIVTDLGASLDINESMKIVVDGIADSLNVEQCRIALIDDDGKHLTITAEHFNPEKSISALGINLPIEGNTLTLEVLETRKTIVIDDIAHEPLVDGIRHLLEAQGIKSMVVLPMIVGNQVLGTIGIDLLEEGQHFTEDQLELARTIIFQAATAVQNARLYTETQRRAERERMVNAINQKIQGTTTVEGALQMAIEELGRALHSKKTRVALNLDKNENKNGRNNTK